MTNEDHPDDDTLTRYALEAPMSSHDAVEAHLVSCDSCRDRVAIMRVLQNAFSAEETWWAADELGEGGRSVRNVHDYTARIAAEDEEALRLLAPYLASPPYKLLYDNVADKRRFRTGGVVRLLCTTANRECERAPLQAKALADTARAIAEALPDDYYPSGAVHLLRGTAWKEYANACRYLGLIDAGLDAITRAERAFRHMAVPGPSLASAKFVRATLLWKQQRPSEALALFREAAKNFASYGDVRRFLEAKMAEGVMLTRIGDYPQAREVFDRVEGVAETLEDPSLLARVTHNIGNYYMEMADVGRASQRLLHAMQLYEGLGLTTEVLRSRWSIAQLALAAGNGPKAERRLLSVIQEFEEAGMHGDAQLARLHLAEALLIQNRHEDVEAICASLVAHFKRARMVTGALTAAAFLSEAASQRRLKRAHIQAVRNYLAQLEAAPELAFSPPGE